MQTDFKVRELPPLIGLSKRLSVRLATIAGAIGGGFGDVYANVAPLWAAAGEPFVVYHGTPTADDEPFEIELVAPMSRAIDPPAGWRLVELPAGTFATVLHIGPYANLGETYDALAAWIADEGYAIAGPPREVYLTEPAVPPEELRTVVEFPVARSTAAVPATA